MAGQMLYVKKGEKDVAKASVVFSKDNEYYTPKFSKDNEYYTPKICSRLFLP